jgi:hypothetical protein
MKTKQTRLLIQKENHVSAFSVIEAHQTAINKVRNPGIHPERTAIGRKKPTLPLRIALKKIDFEGKTCIELGSGRSIDAKHLSETVGATCFRYDPYFTPLGAEVTETLGRVDVVLVIYLLNVLPPAERDLVANCAARLVKPGGSIVVGVREDKEAVQGSWRPFEDGYTTSRGTFQTFFDKDDPRLPELFPGHRLTRIGRGTWLAMAP